MRRKRKNHKDISFGRIVGKISSYEVMSSASVDREADYFLRDVGYRGPAYDYVPVPAKGSALVAHLKAYDRPKGKASFDSAAAKVYLDQLLDGFEWKLSRWDEIELNLTSSAGLFTRGKSSYGNTKLVHLKEAVAEAQEIVASIFSGQHVHLKEVYMCGGRAKVVASAAEVKQGRLIQPGNAPIQYSHAMVFKSLYDFFINDPSSPIAIGLNQFGQGWNDLASNYAGLDWFISGDVRKLDANMNEEIRDFILKYLCVMVAGGVNSMSDSLYQFLYNTVSDRLIATPDGVLISTDVGFPSGAYLTGVMDSIYMYLVTSLSCDNLGWNDRVLFVSGDDFLLGCRGPFENPVVELDNELGIVTGVTRLALDKTDLSTGLLSTGDDDLGAHFLSHYFMEFGGLIVPYRTTLDLLVLWRCPEYNSDIYSCCARARGLMVEGFFNKEAFGYFDAFLTINKEFVRDFHEDRDSRKFFGDAAWYVLSYSFSGDIPSVGELLDLFLARRIE